MNGRVLVLGAGFGGLELATVLSEALGDDAGVTLIEGGDAFVFGYSKLDVMFGQRRLKMSACRTPTSPSPASASSQRRSLRSIRIRGG